MEFAFGNHLLLVSRFLDRREQIVDSIEKHLLNVQGKDLPRHFDRRRLDQGLSSCFFDGALPAELAKLEGSLSAAHRASGFDAVQFEGDMHQFSAAQLVAFAHEHWSRHRWPGRNLRLAYAHTIFSAFVFSQLEHLTLRIWDESNERCKERLAAIQALLDRLNGSSPASPFVRSARWLIQTAQGPLTRQPAPYFHIAAQITDKFAEADRLEIHRAGALLAGGHLRSQLRYRARAAEASIDDPEVLSVTRNSNSMDAALLVADLVPLLRAYTEACRTNDESARGALSDVILQALSADPELLVTRLDVLGPATTLEDVFIERTDTSRPAHTVIGERHLRTLAQYRELIVAAAPFLQDDARQLDPRGTAYSPFGIVYGFCADILASMAIATLMSVGDASLTLEDMFAGGDAHGNKRAQAAAWESLPHHRSPHPRFEHSIEGAIEIFDRLLIALNARTRHTDRLNASEVRTARLVVTPEGQSEKIATALPPDGDVVAAQECYVTSDLPRALASGATAFPRNQILSDRREGRFLASLESDGKWLAVSKILLTTCICRGKDARIAGVSPQIVDVLQLTCPGMIEVLSA